MLKSALLDAIQREILRHDFGTYVDDPPAIAHGGKGIVVAGCPTCKKRLQSMHEFLRHLAEDAMPALLNRLTSTGHRPGEYLHNLWKLVPQFEITHTYVKNT